MCSLTGLYSLDRDPRRTVGPVHRGGKLTIGVNVTSHGWAANRLTMVHVIIKTMIPQISHPLTTERRQLDIARLVDRETDRRTTVRFGDHSVAWFVPVTGVSVVDGQN